MPSCDKIECNLNEIVLYVCYSINDLYAREAGISMLSFLMNNPGYEPEELFFIDYGIHPSNKQRLDGIAARYGKRITYIDTRSLTTAVKREFPHLISWRGSMAPNIKAFVDQVFPEYVERLLFIDADTIVAGSVAELQRMDMGGAALGIVPANSHCKTKTLFNSGVLLFNMPVWRREGCHQMIINTLRSKIRLRFPDQDLLNAAIPQRLLKALHPKYNYYGHGHHPRVERCEMRIGNVFTEAEIDEAVQHPVIIHYLGGWCMSRPWNVECRSRRADDYFHYKALSPWKDAPLNRTSGWPHPPHGFRQHLEYWRLSLYATCPSFRLIKVVDFFSIFIINTLNKIIKDNNNSV